MWAKSAKLAIGAASVAFIVTGVLIAGDGPLAPAADPTADGTEDEVAFATPDDTSSSGETESTPSPVPSDGVEASTEPVAPPSPTAEPTEPTEPPPAGLLTFRGNTTRTFYGTGPIPTTSPRIAWRYPDGAMCGNSTVGGETRQWCGTGWTGQPAVFERDDRTWVVFGGYDRAVHFVDGDTGEAILPPFPTGDIIKGTVTVDPDHPIVFSGSRDGRYRAIAFDGAEPRELWALSSADATGPTRWNDDWDGSGLLVDDHLLIGGENSRFFLVELERGYGPDGLVTLEAEVVADVAGWDDELIAALGDSNVSIETSVAFHDGHVYFANSGGLVQGWDLRGAMRGTGEPERVFRFWIGDDTDATVVIDDEGMLYAAAEWERFNTRARDLGQVVKLDPSRPEDPLVWSAQDPVLADGGGRSVAGVWGTPAIHEDLLLVPFTGGDFVAFDRATGQERWRLDFVDHLWSSPVVADGVLLQGDCAGALHAFDLDGADRRPPAPLWTAEINGCVESTPAVWEGQIWVGTRAGWLVALHPPLSDQAAVAGQPPASASPATSGSPTTAD